MQIQSKCTLVLSFYLRLTRGFLVKTRSEALSRVSRSYKSCFSPYKFCYFLFFHASISFFLSKIFIFSLRLLIINNNLQNSCIHVITISSFTPENLRLQQRFTGMSYKTCPFSSGGSLGFA